VLCPVSQLTPCGTAGSWRSGWSITCRLLTMRISLESPLKTSLLPSRIEQALRTSYRSSCANCRFGHNHHYRRGFQLNLLVRSGTQNPVPGFVKHTIKSYTSTEQTIQNTGDQTNLVIAVPSENSSRATN
jgi:hypothetical protein